MNKKIALTSLGCDKNRIDSEKILYNLTCAGFEIVQEHDAEIIIVNTCGFIEPARKESIDTILEISKLKNQGNLEKLIVVGCLAKKYKAELEKELFEADAIMGAFDYHNLPELIYSLYNKPFDALDNCGQTDGRLLTTLPHYAYLKIAEGCANKCAFCTIPSIRGKYISRAIDDIFQEAQKLVNSGVKELILIAQDVTRYGQDINNGNYLFQLLQRLTQLDCRYRLMYCYPELITDELLDFITANDNIIKYIDVPVQHINDRILKLMNRRYDSQTVKSLFDKLHERNIIIRTSLMAGFPSETEQEFEQLCEFVKTYKPQNAGVFAYSREKGTAAYNFKPQIPSGVKSRRTKALANACLEVLTEFNKSQTGKIIDVVYEGIDYDKNLFYGRADFQAPDIDGQVYFKADFADIGKTYKVKITQAEQYDLIGEVLE